MKTVDFLDAAKMRHKLTSDYQLAKLLRWPTQRISLYRTTAREFDDAACVQIAEVLEVPAAYVMACVAAARAKRADIKKHWLAAARLLKTGTAAAILATAGLLSQPAPGAANGATAAANLTPYTLCAKRRRPVAAPWRRRRRRKSHTVTPRTPILASRT